MDITKAEQLINAIEPPHTLSDRQVHLAKLFVKEQMLDGFTVQNFCSANSLSSKSWYSWIDDADFKYYLNQIQDAVIPQDEKKAYEQMKKHLLKIPYMQNPSPKQIELFMDVFSYLADHDKKQKMESLGISNTNKTSSSKSVEDRKNALIGRLTGKPNQVEKGEDTDEFI